MQPDDVFRARLDSLLPELRGFAERIGDVATCEETDAEGYWGLAIRPHDASACAVELILHRASQRYDVMIGDEAYEARPIARMDLFLPMLEAVVAGDVVTRTWTAAATGAMHSVETLVRLPGGTLTGERENAAVVAVVPREDCLARDRHWAPYRLVRGDKAA